MKAEASGDVAHAGRARERIGRSHVRDDPHPAVVARAEDRLHPLRETRIEPGLRVLGSGLLGDRDGSLRQALEHQVVERATLHELDRGLDPIPGVSGPAPDAQGPPGVAPRRLLAHGVSTPKATAATVMRTVAANSQGAVKR